MSSGSKEVKSTSGQASNSTGQQQQSWIPNPAAEDLYGMIAGNTQQLMQTPSPYFPGQGYVGPSALTQQGVNLGQQGIDTGLKGIGIGEQGVNLGQQGVGYGQQGIAQMNPLLNQATGNYNFLSNAADVANNPYVQGMIKQNEVSAGDWLKNQALPQLQAGAIGVNNLGSSRLGIAQGQAVGDAQKNLLAQNAATQMGAYTQGLGAQQQALGQTGAMLSNYLAPSQAQFGLGQNLYNVAQNQFGLGQTQGQFGQMAGQLGQTTEGYQQKALEDAMARYSYQYQEPWLRMQNAAQSLQALQPLGTGYGSNTGYGTGAGTSTQPNPGYKSPWQTIGGLGLMAGGAMLSTTGAGAAAGVPMMAAGAGTLAG